MASIRAYVKEGFRNLHEFHAWVNGAMDSLSPKNRSHWHDYTREKLQRKIRYDPHWYGVGATADGLIAGTTSYRDPKLIDRLLAKVSHLIDDATKALIQKRRMNVNDRGMGLFSFDRAAMGLYRIKELYSPSLERKVEPEECVKVESTYTLEADGSPVEERWELRGDGSSKVRTSTKKVFAWFPRKEKERKAVEMYIAPGGNGSVTAERMLYGGLAAIVVAQMLEMANIPTKISIAYGLLTRGEAYMALVPAKNYDETLDLNLIATISSDPRFYRYEGFRTDVAICEHFNAVCPGGHGIAPDRRDLIRIIEDSTYTPTAALAPNRLYFGGTFNEEAAVSQIEQAIKIIKDSILK